KTLIKQAKDITRGGLSAILNEICEKNKVSALIFEENIPIKEGVKRSVEFLGINLYDLACEGRFICVCDKENVKKVVTILKKFNEEASIIGHITDKTNGHDVVCQTKFGKKLIHKPTGNIVPRIC
ncbi:MAG: AIR synthase-related protein, partial [Candidatus Woesearchaeota archaeon]